jgi:asparagine synthase (glutamine-hydrolysing)
MCGICVIVCSRPTERAELQRTIDRMARAQAHRGPDRTATWVGDGVALGHNRLRVVDLDPRSDQPFARETGSPRLVYNGEIYNRHLLRRDLESQGVRFRTTSDTEVLYEALCRWGEGALDRIHGMFAFACYWPDRGLILAARDRMGIKPLQVARTTRGILLASEVAGALSSGWLDGQLDPEAVYQVARFNHLLGNRTAVRGIDSVGPGELLRIHTQSGAIETRRYWQLRFSRTSDDHGRRCARLDDAFRAAVRSHMDADLPVASYMSGGIDSTALAREASRAPGAKLCTYSLAFPGQPYDEAAMIDRVLETLDVDNRRVAMHAVSLPEYERYIRHAAMPQLWTTDLALERLADGVRRAGHRVVLSGEGPDELFAGYDAFRWGRMRDVLTRLGTLRLLERLPARFELSRSISWFDIDLAMIRFYAAGHREAERNGARDRYGFYPENIATWGLLEQQMKSALSGDFVAAWPRYREREETSLRALFGPETRDCSHLQANLLFELGVRMPNWVLLMGDRMSAAHGLEMRLPYLDDGFVEVALELPDRDRLFGLDEKHILKAIHRERVPAFVRRRHKQPLYTPITEWVGSFFGDPGFEAHWSKPRFDEVGLFDHAEAARIADRVQRGRYRDLLDRLSHEWMFLLMLSTHVIESHLRSVVADARAEAA